MGIRVKIVDRQINKLMVKCSNTFNVEVADKNKKEKRLRWIKRWNSNKSNNSLLGQKRNRSLDDDEGENNNHKKRKLDEIESCQWKGCYSDFNTHIQSCPLQTVRCEYCSLSMKRKELRIHYLDCPLFIMQCMYCKVSIVRKELRSHYEKCPSFPMQCEQCNESVLRGNLVNHLKNECKETLIECAFKRFGCMEKVRRKNEKKHIEENTFAHMSLMANHQTKLEKKVKTLEVENKALLAKVDSVKTQSRQYTNRQLSEQMDRMKKKIQRMEDGDGDSDDGSITFD